MDPKNFTSRNTYYQECDILYRIQVYNTCILYKYLTEAGWVSIWMTTVCTYVHAIQQSAYTVKYVCTIVPRILVPIVTVITDIGNTESHVISYDIQQARMCVCVRERERGGACV